MPYSKQDKRPHGAASSWYRDYDTPRLAGNAARRRMRRVVGVRMGLPCHDGEVEGVVVEDDAVLASFFPFCFLHFPSLVSANTPSLKANPLCLLI